MASSSRTGRRRRATDERDEEEIMTDVAIALCAVAALEASGHQRRHTSVLTGHQYMLEVLNGHPDRIYDKCRMEKNCFTLLCEILSDQGKLQPTRTTSVEEQVMIFLTIVGKNETIRTMMEDFQHSGEMISKHVTAVCNAICDLKTEFIRPPDFNDVPWEISANRKYYPFFKDCIGAMDGTHVYASVPREFADRYRNHKGLMSQNVMVVCNFKMMFTYVITGWEESAHDSRVLNSIIDDPNSGFPHPPPGKYYLVDAGYPNRDGFLAPHRRLAYHISDYRRNRRGPQELFNYRHASLRNVIERTFGVLKKRFHILNGMNNYPLDKQGKIVMACCVFHNFIRMYNMDDRIFEETNNSTGNEQVYCGRQNGAKYERNGEGPSQPQQGIIDNMTTVRDNITNALWAAQWTMS